MEYSLILNNKVLAVIYASNAYGALQYFKRLPKYRELSMTEQFSVKVNKASQWGALLSINLIWYIMYGH